MKLPVNYNLLHFTERKKVRESYVKIQNGLCHYCGNPLNGKASEDVMAKRIKTDLFPDSFFKWPVHLHHSHVTGMTIGAVHCYCNAVLWQYEDE